MAVDDILGRRREKREESDMFPIHWVDLPGRDSFSEKFQTMYSFKILKICDSIRPALRGVQILRLTFLETLTSTC